MNMSVAERNVLFAEHSKLQNEEEKERKKVENEVNKKTH